MVQLDRLPKKNPTGRKRLIVKRKKELIELFFVQEYETRGGIKKHKRKL